MILLVLTLFLPACFNAQAATSHAAANTNLVPSAVPPRSSPLDSHTKTRAGFLAGAGLVVISLLVLAAGLALVRTLKQR